MIIDELAFIIRETFGITLTAEQEQATQTFCRFLTDRDDRTVMIMRGCAGTGKTSLAGAFVSTLVRLEQRVVLMAPTGRAAKVFSGNVHRSSEEASTIHRRIYRQKELSADVSGFSLGFNSATDTLFMVDEASMVANSDTPLLDDLITYVYSGRNCRLLLIGDAAQLPPVGEEESPALQAHVLRSYGLTVYECDLNEVLRQSHESGILFNATRIREQITLPGLPQKKERGAEHPQANPFRKTGEGYSLLSLPRIRFHSFADIIMVPGDELIESLNTSYSQVGVDDTIVVTRSNKRANIYNQGIRNTVLGREEELTTGDMLMVVKNNYCLTHAYFAEKGTANGETESSSPLPTGEGAGGKHPSFIANGDRVRIQRVRNVRELYGFRFADVWLKMPDYDNYEFEAVAILDSLQSEAPALTREQNERLFQCVMEDYADIPRKAERLKKLKEDKFYNALQIKYAYAVTCHKAQGGQWAHVYIDQGYMTDEMLTPDYIHWLYTAFTRATERLFLVNWPKAQTEEPL